MFFDHFWQKLARSLLLLLRVKGEIGYSQRNTAIYSNIDLFRTTEAIGWPTESFSCLTWQQLNIGHQLLFSNEHQALGTCESLIQPFTKFSKFKRALIDFSILLRISYRSCLILSTTFLENGGSGGIRTLLTQRDQIYSLTQLSNVAALPRSPILLQD